MYPAEHFRHCPRCGHGLKPSRGEYLECETCGFVYFFNPTVSAAAFLSDGHGRYLFIHRAKEPAKGKLAIPGGFIDIGETAEAALEREVREEVGIEIEGVAFIGTCTNDYPYRGVTYPVVDLIFTATARDPAVARPLDAVARIEWLRLEDVDPDALAFPSLRMGWSRLRDAGA